MTVEELTKELSLENLTPTLQLTNEIKDVYICDLLSWVMSSATEQCALVTIRGNVNVIGAAVLVGVSCVIIAESAPCESDMIKKAVEQEVPVLRTTLSSYQIAKKFAELGI